jgi:membrane protein DedA with SNARE-associated domain/pimeloyl-ACP methyl ester carboxylesterase
VPAEPDTRTARAKSHFLSWRYLLLLAYAALLLASYVQRWLLPPENIELTATQARAFVPEVDGQHTTQRKIEIVYSNYRANTKNEKSDGEFEDNLPVLLIHGSPGGAHDFNGLAELIQGKRRLIAPDLPGFGKSTHDIKDYSFQAHAAYMWELLDQLGIQKIHLVGFSMGGGVVLHMAHSAPQRVASVTMLSAIGVQELELLGDYHLNHLVHGVQLVGLELLTYAVPHFGRPNEFFGIPYARNFYQSDQRPLRGFLLEYSEPMLIIHGRKDPLVPFEAALEHERLVPQSKLFAHDGNHFTVFADPQTLVEPLQTFWDSVEQGTATTRATADPQRILQAAAPMDTRHWPKPLPITAFVLFVGLALATLVSEDLACITAGLLVSEGRAGFVFVTLACLVGIVAGDILLYLVGKIVGRRALRKVPLRWLVSPEGLQRSSDWLNRNGLAVIFTSRFVPGTRLPTYLAAGVLNTSLLRFSFYMLLACAVWTPLLVGSAAGLLTPLMHFTPMGGKPLVIKLVVAAIVLLVAIRVLLKAATHRGRRELAGWFKRKVRWEFWPPYVFYPPVFLYVIYLGIKHRGFTVFTAANPAILAGGFVGESKHDILQKLSGASEWLPRFTLIAAGEAEQRISAAKDFLARAGLAYPVVLKPDMGQRGSGVAIIRSEEDLRDYLTRTQYDAILQEYVGGQELGVFYYRYPGEARGRIFSITEKILPTLTGDGKKTLEELILDDDRAVCMADFYRQKNEERLQEIPPAGSGVRLVELGTHCRGAVFLDGVRAGTPQLEEAIDKIARTFEGFYFGRFDIRIPSSAKQDGGGSFKVLELNGVSSEATHIYDPKLGLIGAYRVLFEQWRIAFEIGALNRASGTKPAPISELVKLMTFYSEISRGHISGK